MRPQYFNVEGIEYEINYNTAKCTTCGRAEHAKFVEAGVCKREWDELVDAQWPYMRTSLIEGMILSILFLSFIFIVGWNIGYEHNSLILDVIAIVLVVAVWVLGYNLSTRIRRRAKIFRKEHPRFEVLEGKLEDRLGSF